MTLRKVFSSKITTESENSKVNQRYDNAHLSEENEILWQNCYLRALAKWRVELMILGLANVFTFPTKIRTTCDILYYLINSAGDAKCKTESIWVALFFTNVTNKLNDVCVYVARIEIQLKFAFGFIYIALPAIVPYHKYTHVSLSVRVVVALCVTQYPNEHCCLTIRKLRKRNHIPFWVDLNMIAWWNWIKATFYWFFKVFHFNFCKYLLNVLSKMKKNMSQNEK